MTAETELNHLLVTATGEDRVGQAGKVADCG